MFKKGFDNDLYLKLQSETILARIKDCNSDKLYLEFGGKILFDLHAELVLPALNQVEIAAGRVPVTRALLCAQRALGCTE